MLNLKIALLTMAAFAVVGAFVAPAALAKTINMGKISQDELKKSCNANGGELLGVNDYGSYGCEYGDSDTLILCNKNSNCTGYVPARTKADHQKLMGNLNLTAKPPAAKPAAQ